ncbi:MAG: ABC transporter ATP-binding protein, partial [Anaerocolumna sp.]
RKINTFSKGMKKQVSIICGISANTKYIFCDETFDGLDPVMRQAVKSIFVKEISDRNMTPIIASHNLRELEDICNHVGLLHKGGILLSKELFDMKLGIHKIQCVFQKEEEIQKVFEGLELIKIDKRGSLYTLTARGTAEEITERINKANPIFSEVLPLSLEEIFISETEVVGYDIKKLIF